MNDLTNHPAHAHYFRAKTAETLQHTHPLEFFTYPVNGNGYDGHIHEFQGITGYSLQGDKRHFHRFITYTGPAIPLPDGSHYHEVDAKVNDEPFIHLGIYYRTVFTIKRHEHRIYGHTTSPIASTPIGW